MVTSDEPVCRATSSSDTGISRIESSSNDASLVADLEFGDDDDEDDADENSIISVYRLLGSKHDGG